MTIHWTLILGFWEMLLNMVVVVLPILILAAIIAGITSWVINR
jgi:hypothetical protein